jgi:hypothetical protein
MKHPRALPLGSATVVILVGLLGIPGSTGAYTISSLVTSGCHEALTASALRVVRLDVPNAAPLPSTSQERALINDLQFTPDRDMTDLGGATFLIGARDNDLKGRSSDDLAYLGAVHGDPNNQGEHCLRSAGQDEPGGTAAAVETCRAYIRGKVAEAIDGLGANGAPDPGLRTSLPLYLALRGRVQALLPTFYVRIGQATHALEDSFSHTYRTADAMQITVAMNWIDEADRVLDESRDGPGHATKMDVCDDPAPLQTLKRLRATEATVALLRATLDPLMTKDQKMAATDAILDTYVSYKPGCTFENNWCDAPERQYKDAATSGLGCSTTGGLGLMAGLCALLALVWLPRRRRPPSPLLAALMTIGALSLPVGSARAQTAAAPKAAEATPAAGQPNAPPLPVVVPVVQPGPRDPGEGAWGAEMGLSAAVNKPAFAVQLGVRRRLSAHWTVGVDAEWNSWISLYGPTNVRAGVFNGFGTAILRFPLAYEKFNLRTTANLGVSYLLLDLYGAPKGSLGVYGALYPLGVEYKVNRMFLIIINPLGVAVPVPQLRGVPLAYWQYRFNITIGIMNG